MEHRGDYRGQIKQARASWACVLGRDPGENRGRLLLRERGGCAARRDPEWGTASRRSECSVSWHVGLRGWGGPQGSGGCSACGAELRAEDASGESGWRNGKELLCGAKPSATRGSALRGARLSGGEARPRGIGRASCWARGEGKKRRWRARLVLRFGPVGKEWAERVGLDC